MLVEEGIGYAICLDKLIHAAGGGPLCFRPFHPLLCAGMDMIWKKYQVFSKPRAVFLSYIKKLNAGH